MGVVTVMPDDTMMPDDSTNGSAKLGRHTKLTPWREKRLLDAIAAPGPIPTRAAYAGIDVATCKRSRPSPTSEDRFLHERRNHRDHVDL